MQKKYEASLTNGPIIETIARDLETPQAATHAIQQKVEQMRIEGVTRQIEGSIRDLLDRENQEVGHFIFKPGSTKRIAVKVNPSSSTIPPIPENMEEGLNDLLQLGTQKPLGYLPFEHIERFTTPEALQKELEERGLIVKIYAIPRVPSLKFMYAYDQTALQKLLDENTDTLDNAGWPKTVKEFVERVAIGDRVDAYTEIFTLIATAFGDFTNPGRNENIIGPDN